MNGQSFYGFRAPPNKTQFGFHVLFGRARPKRGCRAAVQGLRVVARVQGRGGCDAFFGRQFSPVRQSVRVRLEPCACLRRTPSPWTGIPRAFKHHFLRLCDTHARGSSRDHRQSGTERNVARAPQRSRGLFVLVGTKRDRRACVEICWGKHHIFDASLVIQLTVEAGRTSCACIEILRSETTSFLSAPVVYLFSFFGSRSHG